MCVAEILLLIDRFGSQTNKHLIAVRVLSLAMFTCRAGLRQTIGEADSGTSGTSARQLMVQDGPLPVAHRVALVRGVSPCLMLQ